jgi:hypothetical protein
MKKGIIRELKSNSGRERINIHGAMNTETFETTIISSESNDFFTKLLPRVKFNRKIMEKCLI